MSDLPPDIPPTMVVPSMRRRRIFEPYQGVLQIMVTRACDLSCFGCTAGSNLRTSPATMTPDQFEAAIRSLGFPDEGHYFGIVGVFGGNPASSRYFEDYCRILRDLVPFPQRGLWCNNLLGKGKVARETFDPRHSNINVHLEQDAYDEFRRDWPEALDARREHTTEGLTVDAVHGSPWVGMRDQESLSFPDGSVRENTPENRLELIGDCDINKHWSAMICLVRGELRGFFCEIAGHMAAMHGDNPNWAGTGQPMPDVGLPVEPGWWRRPLVDFADQVRQCCHNCGVPMRRPGQKAIGGEREEFSETHRFIARPKRKGREVAFISSESLGARSRPATEYLKGVTPKG